MITSYAENQKFQVARRVARQTNKIATLTAEFTALQSKLAGLSDRQAIQVARALKVKAMQLQGACELLADAGN